MFKRLPDLRGEALAFTIDGRAASGRRGDTVAAALLAAGELACRTTPVSGAPRAPYCLMGVCFECLVTIDGTGNRQGCLVPLVAGMRIETQRGARAVGIPDAPRGLAAHENAHGPHAEVPPAGRPRSTHEGGASFEAPLRFASQDEDRGGSGRSPRGDAGEGAR